MISKALLKAHDQNELKSIVSCLKSLLKTFYIQNKDNSTILIYAEDCNEFSFLLKQFFQTLTNDFNLYCDILIIPFENKLFEYLIEYCNRNIMTAFELLVANYDNKEVKDMNLAIYNSLGYENIETIKEYIENNLQGYTAAKQLYLHRNSFLYRLKKVVEKTEFEYNDLNSVLWFKLISCMY